VVAAAALALLVPQRVLERVVLVAAVLRAQSQLFLGIIRVVAAVRRQVLLLWYPAASAAGAMATVLDLDITRLITAAVVAQADSHQPRGMVATASKA
jgi:hypothetical protein